MKKYELLREPRIHILSGHVDPDSPLKLMFLMETNGGDPAQRDPHRANNMGQIWRADVTIPPQHRNDGLYIAKALLSAFGTMVSSYKGTSLAVEGAPFKETQ